jgi:hypothetical protein
MTAGPTLEITVTAFFATAWATEYQLIVRGSRSGMRCVRELILQLLPNQALRPP